MKYAFAAILAFVLVFQSISVHAAENEPFIAGADFSHVAWLESIGKTYKSDGVPADPFDILKKRGINYIRLRLFTGDEEKGGTDPYNRINVLNYNLPLARRIKKAGLKLLLDFHYSDSWADPGKQFKPEAWKDLPFDELKRKLFEYNRDVIRAFKEIGALPDMVQIGNEITPGMLWPDGRNDTEEGWDRLAELIKTSVAGVRDAAGDAEMPKIMIHIDRGGHWETSRWFFDNLVKRDVPFDVIGQSYYPFWHGTPDDLQACLDGCAERYKKPVVICETAFPWRTTHWDGKPVEPIVGIAAGEAGQVEFVERLGTILTKVPEGRGSGLFWWAAEFLPVEGVNMADFESRSFFDHDGNVLPVVQAVGKLAR